jgi:tetratricopeptide (TPR) repeat protein
MGAILASDGVSLNRPAEAVEPLTKALDITEEAARQNPADYTSRSRVGNAARDLGNVLQDRDPQRALEVYDMGIQRLGEVAVNFAARSERATLLADSSYPLRSLHRLPEAKQRIDRAFAVLKETGEYPAERIRPDSAACGALGALADYYADAGDLQRAIRIYEQLLEKTAAFSSDGREDLWTATNLSNIYRPLAGIYRRAGDRDKAREIEARRQALWSGWNRKLPENPFVLRQLAAK